MVCLEFNSKEVQHFQSKEQLHLAQAGWDHWPGDAIIAMEKIHGYWLIQD